MRPLDKPERRSFSRRGINWIALGTTIAALFVGSPVVASGSDIAAQPSVQAAAPSDLANQRKAPYPNTFTRVTVHVLGVFSLRGFFNMQARLYQTQGLARYKFNLRDSEMVVDFKPGVFVRPAEITQLMVQAGYRPGPFSLQQLPANTLSAHGSGWMEAPSASDGSPLSRWLKMNF
jgi:hypothetical protein